jgi:hypothetical protein
MLRLFFLILLSLGLAVTDARTQQVTPVLRYTPPSNAYRSAVAPPEDYSLNGMNASVQVYQFRPFNGDIQSLFQTTLLRDWITPMHQEENVAVPPTFQTVAIPGAELALAATFAENIVGLPKPHFRLVIVAAGQAAIFDVSAGTAQSWQMAVPVVDAMAGTLQVEAERAPPPLGRAAGGAVAGLYVAVASKYMTGLIGSPSYFTNALHYYLFSADGRVYCHYDQLEVPGGNIARFDFDGAERNDPPNSGRYTVDGDKLIIRMGGNAPRTIVTDVPRNGSVTINSYLYKRQ